jgi:hypothetical protein
MLRFIPRFFFHEVAKIWATSVLRAVFSHFGESAGRDEVRLETFVALPRAIFPCTVGASRRGLTICRHVVELLTPCALKRHDAFLLRFHSDFDITQMGQL